MTTRLQLEKQTYHETPAKGWRMNTIPPKRSQEEVASKTKKIKKHKCPTPSPTQSDSEGTESSRDRLRKYKKYTSERRERQGGETW